jgi:hypothetical protein
VFRAAAGQKKAASLVVKETNERRTLNIERPTSNNVSCQFKKKPEQSNLPFEILLFSILWFVCFKIDIAQRYQYSMFDVGRSMFGVQSVHGSGQTEISYEASGSCDSSS